MDMAEDFDAIILGAGQAGPSLAARLTGAGLRTALVERSRVGGSCVNFGCTPTKTLVASARAAHMARRAAALGVQGCGRVEVDMSAVKARKDRVVAESHDGLRDWLEHMKGLSLLHGHARFEGPGEIRVGDDLLRAERIFINTGARARIPDLPGIDSVPYLTSSGMMDIDALPPHLVVLGGGYVALEFAQMYRRFGSRVTLVERAPRLASPEDPDVSEALQAILEDEGVEIRLASEALGVERRDHWVAVRVRTPAGEETLQGSHLLLGVGRVPNSDDLGLESAGIETDSRGYIRVDDRLETGVPGVWALGDVNGRGAFTHTAYDDYEIVAANLLDGADRKVSERIPAYALYTDPPLGRVGISEREARESGRAVLVGSLPMSGVARARERDETSGLMKVLVDADTRRILGAAVLGIGGDEVIHVLMALMYADAPYTLLKRTMMGIHPTVSELLPSLVDELRPLDPQGGKGDETG
jgi:pyruvate/2-oxoglutarate dehydrogenase complex dihydrolipoamide dehydrogenase (E3) component